MAELESDDQLDALEANQRLSPSENKKRSGFISLPTAAQQE